MKWLLKLLQKSVNPHAEWDAHVAKQTAKNIRNNPKDWR